MQTVRSLVAMAFQEDAELTTATFYGSIILSTEYSGMHFGFFYLAEYLNLFIVASVAATIFLGGWMPLHIVGLDGFNAIMDYIPGFIWFFGKAFFVVFLLMWIKWTFPRLRIDQILALEWKYLVPISMVNLILMVLIVVFKLHF